MQLQSVLYRSSQPPQYCRMRYRKNLNPGRLDKSRTKLNSSSLESQIVGTEKLITITSKMVPFQTKVPRIFQFCPSCERAVQESELIGNVPVVKR